MKWLRMWLSTLLLLLLVVCPKGGDTSAASIQQQQTPAPQSQPAKPILLTDGVPDPKQAGVLWFPQTGHTIRGAFLDYWNRYGGLAQFGYPLTETFTEPNYEEYGPLVGRIVQYFERARFELHDKNVGTDYFVQLGPLVPYLHTPEPPAPPMPPPASYFPEMGHNLSGAFKAYWHTHGGLFVNGYPITEPVREKSKADGKEYLVQYFERARYELHPENAGTPYEVLLGRLGAETIDRLGYSKGNYPLYSHAGDLSWVAGVIYPTPPYMMPCRSVPNTLHSDYSVTPIGPIAEAEGLSQGTSRSEARLILFGHLAGLSETPSSICGFDAPPYVVERIQWNPVP